MSVQARLLRDSQEWLRGLKMDLAS